VVFPLWLHLPHHCSESSDVTGKSVLQPSIDQTLVTSYTSSFLFPRCQSDTQRSCSGSWRTQWEFPGVNLTPEAAGNCPLVFPQPHSPAPLLRSSHSSPQGASTLKRVGSPCGSHLSCQFCPWKTGPLTSMPTDNL
jgi:hypothetical protein